MDIPGFIYWVPQVKIKMRNLRSTYYKKKKKIDKSKASGSSSDNIYVPNLKWFNELLLNILTNKLCSPVPIM